MKTLIAALFLTFALLSAGAGASDNSDYLASIRNVTVVEKNQAWPPKTGITVEPCSISRCLDA